MVETAHKKTEMRKETKMDLVKLRLDSNGISYDVPAEVEADYGTMRKDRDDAVAESKAKTAAHDELQAKHDALTEEHEKLKKVDNAAEITAGVKARSDLVAKVKPMLSEEDAKKADDMTDAELRMAGVKAQVENFDEKDADGKERSDEYMTVRLEAAVETFDAAEKIKREDGAAVIGDHSGHVDAKDLGDARAKMQARRDGTAKDKDAK